jgi:hypothetical protein
MKVLQLCCISNLWPSYLSVESHDIKTGSNVLNLPLDYGKAFDLIVSAPPCDQFTKSNSHNWNIYPAYFISVALHCFNISINSGKHWLLENPPGRIESFLPGLKQFRLITWHGNVTNKEYIIYTNMLLMFQFTKRYGKPGSINNYSKNKRELWQPDFIQSIVSSIGLSYAPRSQ